ncbi:MAG: hypothetical protein WDN25_26415 [Acetobacteraceae bacterium]
MKQLALVAMVLSLGGGAALAQSAPGGAIPGGATSGGATPGRTAPRGSGTPIDHGPFTPEANRAYQGGGMILQGAPGAPAPSPEATPPGQTPRNMVPAR